MVSLSMLVSGLVPGFLAPPGAVLRCPRRGRVLAGPGHGVGRRGLLLLREEAGRSARCPQTRPLSSPGSRRTCGPPGAERIDGTPLRDAGRGDRRVRRHARMVSNCLNQWMSRLPGSSVRRFLILLDYGSVTCGRRRRCTELSELISGLQGGVGERWLRPAACPGPGGDQRRVVRGGWWLPMSPTASRLRRPVRLRVPAVPPGRRPGRGGRRGACAPASPGRAAAGPGPRRRCGLPCGAPGARRR
jgi:hypothetical protein